MSSKLQIIHEGYLRLQCSYGFVTSSEVDQSLSIQLRDKAKAGYTKMLNAVKEFQK